MKTALNAVGFVLFGLVYFWSARPAEPRSLTAQDAASSSVIDAVRGYKSWQKVINTPALYDSSIAVMCAAPTQQPAAARGPHSDKFILVYVNETGREAMLHQKAPAFPVGSIIVKEKLPSADSRSPELLTAMIKRDEGFNPASGDWEYSVFDGAGKTVLASGKLENCTSCHNAQREFGFVFRTYVPRSVKTTWR